MRESSFIAPLLNNDGEEVTNALWIAESALLHAFGGFTKGRVDGAWRDDAGRVYWDDSVRYTVAADWTPEARAKLREIAAAFAWRAQQLSVYLVTDSGEAEFVRPIEPNAPTLAEVQPHGTA